MTNLLKLKNIHVHYGGVRALAGVDFEIDESEVVVLMGPNGAGKSTVLRAAFGLAPIARGQVEWEGVEIHPIPIEMVERGVAFVPQGRRVFPNLSVLENLEIGGYTIKNKVLLRERLDRVMQTFPMLKLKQKAKSGSLSGGQQQILAVARGLMTDPKLLFLDEPSLGLAPKVISEVFEHIALINQDHKTAIAIVEHNLKSVLQIAHRAYVLDKGQVIKSGEPKELMQTGILEKVFMGQME